MRHSPVAGTPCELGHRTQYRGVISSPYFAGQKPAVERRIMAEGSWPRHGSSRQSWRLVTVAPNSVGVDPTYTARCLRRSTPYCSTCTFSSVTSPLAIIASRVGKNSFIFASVSTISSALGQSRRLSDVGMSASTPTTDVSLRRSEVGLSPNISGERLGAIGRNRTELQGKPFTYLAAGVAGKVRAMFSVLGSFLRDWGAVLIPRFQS